MLEARENLDTKGRAPFDKWFDRLNADGAARVATAVQRIALGNLSKSLGGAGHELRINLGAGYWSYLCRDGERSVILLAGGIRKRQDDDKNAGCSYRRAH